MHPVLISIGSLSISSFGFLLMLGFISATFVAWRLAKTYDLNEEKVLDLVILTFLGGLLGARIYFVATHWDIFGDFGKAILLNRYPGLSFWGGLLGGVLALKLFISRTKLNFWQVADFTGVGLMLGLVFGDMGCFLGGCGYGINSNLPIATSVVGLVGKRFPVSAVESFLLLLAFFYLWRQAVRFHFGGKIISLSLIILALVKFSMEYFRGDSQAIPYIAGFYWGQLWAGLLLVSGAVVFYHRSKRSFKGDMKGILYIVTSSRKRELTLSKLSKSWYNHKVGLRLRLKTVFSKLHSLPKTARRKLNVKPTPTKLSQD